MSEQKSYVPLLKLLLKIFVSAGALLFIASRLDLTLVITKLKHIDPWFWTGAVFLYALSQFISSFRLNTVLRAVPVYISNTANIRLYWIGMFYNFFLPGGIGGDGYKVYVLHKLFRVSVRKLAGAVFTDRLSGLSIIVIFLLGTSFFIDHHFPFQKWLFLAIPFIGTGYYLVVNLVNKHLTSIFWKITGFSLLVQGIQIVTLMLLFKAVGIDINMASLDYFFLFFLSTIASAIPVSLGGIGTREFIFYAGSIYLGTDPVLGITISLLFQLTSMITALPGILFVFSQKSIFNTRPERVSTAPHPV